MKKELVTVLLVLGMTFNITAMSTTELESIKTTITVDGYVKIKSSELTPPVVEEILKEYPTSKLGAAYKNENGDFKLVMVLKSGTRRTVFIDQHGNWITKK